MLTTSFALSTSPDIPTALQETLPPTPPTLILLTTTISRDLPLLLSTLQSRYPTTQIHGATTCGATLTTTGSSPSALALLSLTSSSIASAAATGPSAGQAAAERLKERLPNPKAILVQATPGIEEAVLDGIQTVFPDVPVFGGSAADDTVEGNWRLISSDEGVFEQGVSIVGIGDEIKFGASLRAPYTPSAKSATVTKAEGRTIYELDGRKAADVLGEWVGESIETQCKEGGNVIVECAANPLGIDRGGGAWVGIHAASIDENGAVGLFAEVKEGDVLTVMEKDGGDSVAAAKIGLQAAYEEAKKTGELQDPKAGVFIYCGGLSIAVGDKLDESLQGLKDKPPMLGMTVFGEQGCLKGRNVHSNLAVGVALFE